MRVRACPCRLMQPVRQPGKTGVAVLAQAAVAGKRVQIRHRAGPGPVPDPGPLFQPALEVTAPDHLVDEPCRLCGTIGGGGGRNHLCLAHQAAPRDTERRRSAPSAALPLSSGGPCAGWGADNPALSLCHLSLCVGRQPAQPAAVGEIANSGRDRKPLAMKALARSTKNDPASVISRKAFGDGP